MKFLQLWKPVLVALILVSVVFVAAGILDIVLAVLQPRFYSNAAFCVIFGVAGIFASIMAYSSGKYFVTATDKFGRLVLIITIIVAGIIFFFLLASIENREYEWACRSFGITLVGATIFFIKAKLVD